VRVQPRRCDRLSKAYLPTYAASGIAGIKLSAHSAG
jgi:hypothetical protein